MSNLSEIFRYRTLIFYLVEKQDQASLFGALFGRAWVLLEPLMQVVTYYLLIVVIFKAGESYGVNPLALILMGVTHFLFFRTIIVDVTSSVVNNESILMQIKIHPIIFPATALWSAIRGFIVPMILYWAVHLSLGLSISSMGILLYLFLVLILIILATSIGLICSISQVYARDTIRFLNIILRLLMYAVPALYTLKFVPSKAQPIYLLNPVSVLFAELQSVVFQLQAPSLGWFIYLIVFTLISAVCSLYYFNKKAPCLAKFL